MLAYSGVQANLFSFVGEDKPAEVEWRVTSDGLALGTVATVDEAIYEECQVAQVSEGVFLDIEFACHAVFRDGITGESGAAWAFVGEQLWFDPGEMLTPKVYAESLHWTIQGSGVLEEPPPALVDLDGTPVYPLAVGGGTVYLSEDGVIVKVEDVRIEGLGGYGYEITATVDPAATGPDQIRQFGEELAAVTAEFGEVLFFSNFSAHDTVVDESGVCDGLVCVISAEISFEERIGIEQKYSPVVEFSGEISNWSTSSGAGTCSQTKTVELGVVEHFECTVDLRNTASDPDNLGWTSQVQVRFAMLKHNTAAIAAGVESQISALLGE
ncbi:hypothetical protein AB0B28_04045 [Glycomyces sp. NPDC046736]|uniref:hypothetical protein n=1 Tax=Glycomyces sp. NPDC046736 TaxID=3155615 RepID=UPI0033C66981